MGSSLWFKFVHCADLHLDSPFEGLHALEPEIARVLRRATFQAFENIIDLAIREQADFLIVAGDIYDSANRSLYAQIRFREALRRAAEAGLQCFLAHGNHDPLSGWDAQQACRGQFTDSAVKRWSAMRPGVAPRSWPTFMGSAIPSGRSKKT
jgi:DNA repair exonuclease SbcCD nuclease subunit